MKKYQKTAKFRSKFGHRIMFLVLGFTTPDFNEYLMIEIENLQWTLKKYNTEDSSMKKHNFNHHNKKSINFFSMFQFQLWSYLKFTIMVFTNYMENEFGDFLIIFGKHFLMVS